MSSGARFYLTLLLNPILERPMRSVSDIPFPTRAPEPVATARRSIVIATDGTSQSDGAVRVGRALAQRDGFSADLLSVVEPMPVFPTEAIVLPDIQHLNTIAREGRAETLLKQRDRTHPGIRDWPFDIESGPRVETIVARAERADAALILLGVGAHGVGARLMQRETAVRVMRTARCPVLALPGDAWGVPHSAIVAVDFTESSDHAALTALSLLGHRGTLYLAHVLPRVVIPQGDPRPFEQLTGASSPLAQLQALERRLAPPPSVRVEHVLLHGEAAHEIVAFAAHHAVDMIAAGAHGKSALERFVLGSVSTSLIRTAPCWVLVAPPSTVPLSH
jgi:nucleotide-binding universal stress UspA family protein